MRYLVILWSICWSLNLVAQQPLRLELEVSQNAEPYQIEILGDQGVLIHSFDAQVPSGKSLVQRRIYLTDPYLRVRLATELTLPYEYRLQGGQYLDDYYHFVLRSTFEKQPNPQVYLCHLHIPTAQLMIDTLNLPSRLPTLKAMAFMDRALFLNGDGKDAVLFRLICGDTAFQARFVDELAKQEVWDSYYDTASHQFYILSMDPDAQQDGVQLLSLDSTLATRAHLLLGQDTSRRWTSARFCTRPDLIMVVGGYASRKTKPVFEAQDRVLASQGIQWISLEDTLIRHQQVLAFEHYTLLNQKSSAIFRSEILQSRERRRRQELELNGLIHAQWQNHELRVSVNVFQRMTRSITETYYDYYGRVVPYTRTVFDGYMFHDLLMAVWRSDSLSPITMVSDLPSERTQARLWAPVSVLSDSGQYTLLHQQDDILSYKPLEPIALLPFSKFKLRPLHEGDRIVSTYSNQVRAWYGSFVLVFGYQDIQNSTRQGPGKRSVFYLSKIAYE